MSFFRKIIAVVLVAITLAAALPVFSLAVNDTSVAAGGTATLVFDFVNIYSVSGSFSVSDAEGIVSGYTVVLNSAGSTSANVSGVNLNAAQGPDRVSTSVSVSVIVSISPEVSAGANCLVSFNGQCSDAGMEDGSQRPVYQSALISVYDPSQTEENNSAPSLEPATPSKEVEHSPEPTIPSEEEVPSSKPALGATPAPAVTPQPETVKVYYGELERYMAIANGLNTADYTSETMKSLRLCQAEAREALQSSDQKRVDAATEALARAIGGLVKMDYSALVQAIEKAENYTKAQELAELWYAYKDALKRGEPLLASGDQEAVDAAAAEILDILNQLEDGMAKIRIPKLVEVEVPVEVLPQDDYCNIASHRTWPIFFFISLALNVLAVAIIVIYVSLKRKNHIDDTPLVEYDIDYDDM